MEILIYQDKADYVFAIDAIIRNGWSEYLSRNDWDDIIVTPDNARRMVTDCLGWDGDKCDDASAIGGAYHLLSQLFEREQVPYDMKVTY